MTDPSFHAADDAPQEPAPTSGRMSPAFSAASRSRDEHAPDARPRDTDRRRSFQVRRARSVGPARGLAPACRDAGRSRARCSWG